MRNTIKDFDNYTAKAPPYLNGLLFVQSGIKDEDIKPVVMWLRRTCESTDGLSFMLITSTHDSRYPIERVCIRSGKAGRPKWIVKGRKAKRHYHGLIINESEANDINDIKESLGTYLSKLKRKRPHLTRHKIMFARTDGLPIVKYMTRQMDESKPYSYGDFNFDYYDNVLYCRYEDDSDNYDNILDF